jgi:hypothetical protein
MDLDIKFTGCGHRNILACPNHGASARLFWALMRSSHGRAILSAPGRARAQWPVPFVLTAKGHVATTLSTVLDGPLEV